MLNPEITPISPEQADSLSGLFYQRVTNTPDKMAYRYYEPAHKVWKSLSWRESLQQVIKWQQLLIHFELKAGDSIAIMLKNCPEWVFMEQAALALGLIVVPLYINDRAENVAYILSEAEVKLLLLEGKEQLQELSDITTQLELLTAIITIENTAFENTSFESITFESTDSSFLEGYQKLNIISFKEVFKHLNSYNMSISPATVNSEDYIQFKGNADDLATIVYTSGTTGKPKGVMLSHNNILYNTWAAIAAVPCRNDDIFLSFLPLSHMFERTAGYYIPMMSGAEVAYARSIEDLAVDLQTVKPTVLVTVPRIFERVYSKIQSQLEKKSGFAQALFALTVNIGWKRFQYSQHQLRWFSGLLLWPLLNQLVARKITAKLGGKIRVAISGGAPLSNDVARVFIGLGVTITQGYGLTETAPVISTNKLEDNDPFSVGQILPGIMTRFSDQGELLVRSPSVMHGYWKQKEATDKVIDKQHWLHTGDLAEIREGHLYITGRVKDILVLSNGEKVPPADLEMAICSDPLFEQAMVVGEARPYLSAIVVLNSEQWPQLVKSVHLSANLDKNKALNSHQLKKFVIDKISTLLHAFPGYEQIRNVKLVLQPWTIQNGLITPTMKLKRNKLMEYFYADIDHLYTGHA
jgi:long-chain acyl-CoA synthetase